MAKMRLALHAVARKNRSIIGEDMDKSNATFLWPMV